MVAFEDPLVALAQINSTATFNRWAGIEVVAATTGSVELRLPWRAEFGQYAGFLHAGLVGALIDTACGFAAATMVGNVLAAHYSVNFLSPAVGEAFVVRAKVIKPGRRQVFATAEVFAEAGGRTKLVATGDTILMTVPES